MTARLDQGTPDHGPTTMAMLCDMGTERTIVPLKPPGHLVACPGQPSMWDPAACAWLQVRQDEVRLPG